MKVAALQEALSLRCIAGEAGRDQEVTGCYVGDLLSWVMGRAQEGQAWITVMGNVNAIAVATLRDIACIVLCDGAHLDEEARLRAEENAVPVLAGEGCAFDLALAVGRLLGR